MIGKRKRALASSNGDPPTAGPDAGPSSHGDDYAHAIFQRHFEDSFEPLSLSRARRTTAPVIPSPDHEPEDDREQDEEWAGFSGPEEAEAVEVVDGSTHTRSSTTEMHRDEMKAFMTPRPPTSSSRPRAKHKTVEDAGDLANEDSLNLKNDLALQRLLQESDLLDPSSSLTPSGANRHRAIDLRMQSMGSRASILAQDKMPWAHRKGIVAKAAGREEKRRREARENGVILERPKTTKPAGRERRRERGVGRPGAGSFVGGTLRLSKRDVADIQRPQGHGRRVGKRRS